MLMIPCPTCGPRSVEEFRFGGAAPHVPDFVVGSEPRNLDYAWFLDNLDGLQTERWFHDAGCRRWTTVVRDTNSDTVPDHGADD